MCTLEDIERDFEILKDVAEERKPKIYKKRFTTPFDLDDKQFYSRYRFNKITTRYLIDLLDLQESKNNRGLPIPTSLQLLIALRFFGRNVHQSDIADQHGVSQQTVGRVIKKISMKIALLLPQFIKFPNNDELAEVKKRFYQVAGFPTVIGAIDCSHVRIKCPTKVAGQEKTDRYHNRKDYYSLNVQIVSDADCKIIDIVARSKGSTQDAQIWSECQLKNNLERSKNEHNGVLLGDARYPLSPILLTPITNPNTPKEENYNKSHIATRSKIECLNGQLKSKLRTLFERLRVDVDTALNIIVAVAVLHNIANERNSSFLDKCGAGKQEPHDVNFEDTRNSLNETGCAENSGNAYRTAFIEDNF